MILSQRLPSQRRTYGFRRSSILASLVNAVVLLVTVGAVAVFRIKTGNAIGSATLVADGMHARVDGFTSLAVLIGVIGTGMGYPIVDPIVGVLITIAILFIVKDAAISVLNRMIERIEPEILAEVEHAPTHVQGVRSVHQARARWVGHRVFVDLHITVALICRSRTHTPLSMPSSRR